MLGVFLLSSALAFSRADADFAYETARQFVTEFTAREAGTERGRVSAAWLRDRVRENGGAARVSEFDAVSRGRTIRCANVICDFVVATNAPWVVLVSHFDTKAGVKCMGANDGASTSALLIALARAYSRGRAGGGNLRLIWTDGEECFGPHYAADDGLLGSRHAAKTLAQDGIREVRAVVVLDMLGDADLQISIPSNGDDELAETALKAAFRANLPARSVRRSNLKVIDDHVPFLEAGYPAIDLIDYEFGGPPGGGKWHTSADDMTAISSQSLYKSGRLVTEMLNILL